MGEEVSLDKKRILFVDDEAQTLSLWERQLVSMNKEWDMEFVNSGEKALELMAKEPFDVVVSDMKMPEMGGEELLGKVKKQYPKTIRFLLSAFNERDTVLKTVNVIDQFMVKPCEPEELISNIKHGLELATDVDPSRIEALIQNIDSLPTLPKLYDKLKEEIQSETTGLRDIAKIIQQDVSITAKILQVVNSAFFGLRQKIWDIEQAVVYLGSETIQALVIMAGVYDQFSNEEIKKFSIQEIFTHSSEVGLMTSKILKSRNMPKEIVEKGVMAGSLHDVGKLVFIRVKPLEYEAIFKKQKETKMPIEQLEKEAFGVDHGELGTHLMEKWGLPEEVTAAIRTHHNSIKAFEEGFHLGDAVFIANELINAIKTGEEEGKYLENKLDKRRGITRLNKVSLLKCLPEWKKTAKEIIERREKKEE